MLYILLIPAYALIILVFCIPILRYGWLSMHSYSVMTALEKLPNQGANWSRLLNDERFWQDVLQTIRFTAVSVTIEILIAILIALLLDQRWKGRGAVRAITLLPWALPTTIMALGWRWIFNTPYGPIEQISSLLHLNSVNILSDPNLTWIATVIGDVWKTTPFIALILLAGLQTIPNDLFEAFRLEGGNPRQALFKITLPMIEPYIQLSLLFRIAQSFGVFDLIQVMTGGGPASSTESLGMYAYLNTMRFLDFGYSATIMAGSFIILIIFCLTGWLLKLQIKRLINYYT